MGFFSHKQEEKPLSSEDYLKLSKKTADLELEVENLKQLVRSLRGLVNRKLYGDVENQDTSQDKNKKFNNDVILPM